MKKSDIKAIIKEEKDYFDKKNLSNEINDIRFKGQPKGFEDLLVHFMSPDLERAFGKFLDNHLQSISVDDVLSDIEDMIADDRI